VNWPVELFEIPIDSDDRPPRPDFYVTVRIAGSFIEQLRNDGRVVASSPQSDAQRPGFLSADERAALLVSGRRLLHGRFSDVTGAESRRLACAHSRTYAPVRAAPVPLS